MKHRQIKRTLKMKRAPMTCGTITGLSLEYQKKSGGGKTT